MKALSEKKNRPLGGVAAGVALVLVAVLAGIAAQRVADGGPATTEVAAAVTPTGSTTTVEVSIVEMRYQPSVISVPAGDRLVIVLTNSDQRRHDLVLATGQRTGPVGAGAEVTLDAGVIGGAVDGWCSLPGHRQAGMTLTITTTGSGAQAAADHSQHGSSAEGHGEHGAAPQSIDTMAAPSADFRARDAALPAASGERVHRHVLRVEEVEVEIAPNVRQVMWTYNGTAPGPVLRGKVGDVFEIELHNDGTVDHGVDFHAGALAPDGPMRPIEPGESLTYRFTATKAGIWMYHCSTMPMMLHIANGMYGAVIIDPPDLPAVDREYVLVQSELYLGGDQAKMRAENPDAVAFNGYAAQYAHRPLTAEVGERVRFWLLDVGPNRSGAFHVVGAQFDRVYAEGTYRLQPGDPGGSQVLPLAPAEGGFVETVFPEAGHYPFVSHAMVDAERGARGIVEVTG
ncbi:MULTISPECIES: multicopper oxidase domain-containing protein [Actinosynnema]|uniref:multicopper oxidase domain-containing protein n=1 Tax=Actinosynnema TaxID=40566 RepID=UPI0020A5C4CD|nr:multicopper oxidase domain-containing protein [Actinosynnema pretiosum]